MRFSTLVLPAVLGLAFASPVPEPINNNLVKKDNTTTELKALLAEFLETFPAAGGTINAVASLVTTFQILVAGVTGEQTVYNDLDGPCKTYTVVFARGTTETENVGIFTGPPFFDALKSAVGASEVAIQGVNKYAAVYEGYLVGGDPTGSAEMAREIEAAKVACPNTKLVISGFSQGAQLVHNAAKLLSAETAQWISKAVIFGDPYNGQPLANISASKTKTFCRKDDDFCNGGELILPAHLLYSEDADAAAAFVTS